MLKATDYMDQEVVRVISKGGRVGLVVLLSVFRSILGAVVETMPENLQEEVKKQFLRMLNDPVVARLAEQLDGIVSNADAIKSFASKPIRKEEVN